MTRPCRVDCDVRFVELAPGLAARNHSWSGNLHCLGRRSASMHGEQRTDA